MLETAVAVAILLLTQVNYLNRQQTELFDAVGASVCPSASNIRQKTVNG